MRLDKQPGAITERVYQRLTRFDSAPCEVLANSMRMSTSAMREHLLKLVEAGRVERTGKNRNAEWRVKA